MKFLELLVGAAAATSALAAPSKEASSKKKRATAFEFVGVNESGAEFGNMNLPGQLGKDYTWPVHSAIDVRHDVLMGVEVPNRLTLGF